MKITKSSKKYQYKHIVIVAAIIAAVTGLSLYYVYGYGGSIFGWKAGTSPSSSDVNLDSPSREEKETGESIKEGLIEDKDNDTKTTGADAPTAPVKQSGGKSIVSVSISAINQTADTLQIRIGIGVVTNTGTCSLTVSQIGKTITRSSSVQALPNSSTCEGFDVPLSELPSGKWTVSVIFENETLTGSASRDVDIK